LLSGTGADCSWRIICAPETHSAEFGLALLSTLADELTSESTAPALLVWRSQRAVLVTRQDTHLPHFSESSDRLAAAGWPVVLRKSGGGACPVGPGTVQVAIIEPAVPATTMHAKYEAMAELIQSTLVFYGIIAEIGAVAGAYCPGNYDLAIGGKKIAGMSEYWFRNLSGIRCVVTAGSINVEEAPDVLADAVNRFYSNVGNGFHCQAASLTSVRLCASGAVVTTSLVPAFMKRLACPATPTGKTTDPTFQSTASTTSSAVTE
jgi:lipoate-protein ligase A